MIHPSWKVLKKLTTSIFKFYLQFLFAILESKSSGSESSSSSESSEKKKTVGVRTDVTFEITSGETQNDTKTVDEKEIGKEDDNASIPIVPVFKGTPDRGSNRPVGKDPNFNDIWSVKPLDYPGGSNFQKKDEADRFDSGDNWKQYAIWTTERYNRRHEQPVYHHRGCFRFSYMWIIKL